MFNVVFQPGIGAFDVATSCTSAVLLKPFITIARKQLCRSTWVLIAARLNYAWLHFFFEYFVDVVDLTGINGSLPRNDVKLS